VEVLGTSSVIWCGRMEHAWKFGLYGSIEEESMDWGVNPRESAKNGLGRSEVIRDLNGSVEER